MIFDFIGKYKIHGIVFFIAIAIGMAFGIMSMSELRGALVFDFGNIFMWLFAVTVAIFSILVVWLILGFVKPMLETGARFFVKAKRERKPLVILDYGRRWDFHIGEKFDNDFIEDKDENFVSISPNSLKFSRGGVLLGIGNGYRPVTVETKVMADIQRLRAQGYTQDDIEEYITDHIEITEQEIADYTENHADEIKNFMEQGYTNEQVKEYIESKLRIAKKVEMGKQKESLKKKLGDLVDFDSIKDFVSYGLNKTLIDLKLRRLADIRVRSILKGEKPKKERNWVMIMFYIMIAIIIGIIAMNMMYSYMDYNSVLELYKNAQIELGRCLGEVARAGGSATPPAGNTVVG